MAERKVNFNPGPSTLPLPVLETIRDNMLDYQGCGMSFLEISHRSPQFMEIHRNAQNLLKELLGVPDNYKVLFMGGGASTQFALIAMNFLTRDGSADYINTGTWSKKAIAEAKRFGGVNVAGSTADDNFNHLPAIADLTLDSNARYLHITSNNTIFGTQFHTFPEPGNVPMICDMSSDILSHELDVSKFGMIYAGAQKNLGPAGVTVIILRDDMLEMCADNLPTMFSYKTHVEKDSMFNTPPSGPVYMVEQVLEWAKAQGGLKAVEQMNRDKAALLYGEIDADDYYRGAVVNKEHRSWMNVTLRLPSEELEKKFIAEAAEVDLHGLKGHRSVGGIRASIYNAMPREGVERLVAFMKDFRVANQG
jgi:phosphoserine aminotransferase